MRTPSGVQGFLATRSPAAEGRHTMSDSADIVAFENQIVRWDLVPAEQLLANPRNPRSHPKKQRDALVGSMRELGIIAPVLVNLRTGYLIDGHARVEEITSVDPSRPMPVVFVDVSPEQEAKAIAVFDRITEMADVDKERLESLLREVRSEEPALQKLLAEMAKEHRLYLGPDEGPEDPGAELDRADELQEKWGVEKDQIWQAGEHRILCGDCCDEAAVDRLLEGAKCQMCWTDPPWNVAYGQSDMNPRWKLRAIANDNLGAEFPAFASQFCTIIAESVLPGAPIYMAMSAQEWPVIHAALASAGFHWSSTIIWVKDHAVLSRKDYHTRYEPLWYGWKDGAARLCQVTDRKQNDVWEIPRPTRSDEHPTMKPVELVARALENSSFRGDRVFEPFLGSGSTLVACEQTGRAGLGMDVDPRYVAVTLERLSGMGLVPELDS